MSGESRLFRARGFLNLVSLTLLQLAPSAAENQPSPVQNELQAIRSLIRRSSPRHTDAVYRYGKLLDRDDLTPEQKRTILSGLANSHISLKNFADAVRVLQQALEDESASTRRVVNLNRRLGETLRKSEKPEEARQVFITAAEAAKRISPLEGIALEVEAFKCLTAGGKTDEAIEGLRNLIEDAQRQGASAFALVLIELARTLAAKGEDTKALETYQRLLSLPGLSSGNREICHRESGDIHRSNKRPEQAVAALTQLVIMKPWSEQRTRNALETMIHLLIENDRMDEAIAISKALLHISWGSARDTAVNWVSRSLKAKDGHLARVNRFRRFVSQGSAGEDGESGTEDDLTDPLLDVRLSENLIGTHGKVREAQENLSVDLEGLRLRGYFHLLLCQPVEALQVFRKAFQICPVSDQRVLGEIVREISMADSSVHGHWKREQTVQQWLLYGPAGKDAQANTEDDLTNPWPETPHE